MPDGGTLTIATSLKASQVSIEVRDDGVGMTAEVRDRVFEPFFTTKDVGKGSGLGLSQVYGFVRQSEGHVEIDSTPGAGTTVRLLLPASAEPAPERQIAAVPPETVGGTERLLAVEDDPAVLALAVEMLGSLGYQVTTATNAAEAMRVLESEEPVDLLFSDIVMPGGASGVSLARQAQAIRPEMQILLTSGFVGDGAGLAEHEFPLIDKPYEAAVLAARIREMLDRPKRSRRRKRQAVGAAAAS
jgi:CheY-like chemotaxis protein